MKDELDFTRYWSDFSRFNKAGNISVYQNNPKSIELFYQYLVARSNQELKEEMIKQSEKMDALTRALSAK